MSHKKRILALVLSIALMGSLVVGDRAEASNLDEREAQVIQAQNEALAKQEANRQSLVQVQGEISAFTAQSNSIQAQLDSLLEQNLASTAEYEQLTLELDLAREQMEKSITRYEEASAHAEDMQAEYETRIVTLFKYRNKSLLEVLITSDSIEGFFTNMRLMDYIASADNIMLEDLLTAQEDAEVARQDADETVKQAKAYFEYAEEQLELLRNDIALTETDLSAVQYELLNRSSMAAGLESESNALDADLERYYDELKSIDHEREVEASIAASEEEARRVAASLAASESLRAQQEQQAEADRLEASRKQEQAIQESIRQSQALANQQTQAATPTPPPTTQAPATQAPTTQAPTTQAPTSPPPTTPGVSTNYMMWPLASFTNISSHYGPRVHPLTGNVSAFHYGTDFAAPFGTPIRATMDGTVVIANATWQGQNYTSHKTGHGNYVTIQHANGLTSTYAHMKYVAVSVGQTVKQGEYLGQVGSTGASTGAHLHFEVAQYGQTFNAYSSNWLLHPNSTR